MYVSHIWPGPRQTKAGPQNPTVTRKSKLTLIFSFFATRYHICTSISYTNWTFEVLLLNTLSQKFRLSFIFLINIWNISSLWRGRRAIWLWYTESHCCTTLLCVSESDSPLYHSVTEKNSDFSPGKIKKLVKLWPLSINQQQDWNVRQILIFFSWRFSENNFHSLFILMAKVFFIFFTYKYFVFIL